MNWANHHSACIASIVRISYLHLLNGAAIDVTCKPIFSPWKNLSLSHAFSRVLTLLLDNVVSSLLLTMAECAIGIICVSMPSLRPLLAKLLPNVFKTQLSGTSKSGVASRPKPQSKLSITHSTSSRQDELLDEVELFTRDASWAVLPDPEAQPDAFWELKHTAITGTSDRHG